VAGGLNSYGFAAGDPIGFWDPFGLRADTIIIDKRLRPALDECIARSATCRQMVDSLARDDAIHRIEMGSPGDCGAWDIIGCWEYSPQDPNRTARGTKITLVPGEFEMAAYPVDPTDALSHEVAHVVHCPYSEPCARGLENRVRRERGRPLRPGGPR
jgi:hypothetical protein